jgi:hypothetical protein
MATHSEFRSDGAEKLVTFRNGIEIYRPLVCDKLQIKYAILCSCNRRRLGLSGLNPCGGTNWMGSLHGFLKRGGHGISLGAQMIYLTQPFLGGKEVNAIAHMLEEEEETSAFAHYLRGEVH